jgi:hypothetical protein
VPTEPTVDGADPSLGRWVLCAATATGSAHVDASLPCQDSTAWWCHFAVPSEADGVTLLAVAAVADGAGSATYAGIGSRSAVDAVIELAKRQNEVKESKGLDIRNAEPVEVMDRLFRGARDAVNAAAAAMGADVREFSTTLMVAVVTSMEVIVAEIGDGVVAVRRSGEIVGPLAPQRGEFANETTFLTTGDDLPDLALASFRASEVDAFAMSSDGLRLLITANPMDGVPHAPFFEDVFSGVLAGLGSERLAAFLRDVDDRTGDDLSLVIGVQRP